MTTMAMPFRKHWPDKTRCCLKSDQSFRKYLGDRIPGLWKDFIGYPKWWTKTKWGVWEEKSVFRFLTQKKKIN